MSDSTTEIHTPERCPTCGKPRDLIRTCRCGEVFTMTASHMKWFEDRGLAAPRKCETCRKRVRENQQTHARAPRAQKGSFTMDRLKSFIAPDFWPYTFPGSYLVALLLLLAALAVVGV